MIITEYDLPRKEAQPHDVIIDRDGMAWYSDFGSQFAGVLNPKTGEVKDIPIPVLKPEQPKGNLDIEFDNDQNVWVSLMYQAGITKIDRKTHQVTMYPFPKEWQSPRRRRRWCRRRIPMWTARCGPTTRKTTSPTGWT